MRESKRGKGRGRVEETGKENQEEVIECYTRVKQT